MSIYLVQMATEVEAESEEEAIRKAKKTRICPECAIGVQKFLRTRILKGGRARFYKCPSCGAEVRIKIPSNCQMTVK